MFNLKKKRGASLTGYGLVVGLIAVIAIVAIQGVGGNVRTLFELVSNDMEAVASGTSGSSGGGGSTPSPAALALSIASGDKDTMDVTGPAVPSTGVSVTFTLTNTGDIATATLNAAALTGANFEFTGIGDACGGSVLIASQTCSIEVRPTASADATYTEALSIGDGAASDSITLSGAATGFPPPEGYFVMTRNNLLGDFGGLTAADTICQTELTAFDWTGKSDVADCTASSCSRATAFLCDTATCRNLQASTTYNMAATFHISTGNPLNVGGASFSTDATGSGPLDNKNWADIDALGSGNAIWMNRSTTNSTHWGLTPATSTASAICNNWTVNSGANAFIGASGKTDEKRWANSSTYGCQYQGALICFIDPL